MATMCLIGFLFQKTLGNCKVFLKKLPIQKTSRGCKAFSKIIIAILTLGSWPRQGLVRVWAKKEAHECGRMWEWTLTLPSELPFWKLESRWTSEISKKRSQRSKPIASWIFLYHSKAIETKMSKMVLHNPFGHLKHKLQPKERSGLKLAVWLPTIKSQESTWFSCVQVACNMLLKSSQRGLQLCFKPHPDRRSTHEVIALQGCGSPILGNFRLPFGSLGTKSHLDVGLMERCRVYYKGEGAGFP